MADYAISNVARRVVYANTGVGPYAFTFEILANTDIAVYRGSTLLTLTTDYTVVINANGTGSVTLVTAGTGNITIVGARAIQRTSDYTTGGDLFASTLNTDLDSQTIYVQQVAETAERGIKANITDSTSLNMVLPPALSRANKLLGFNASGEPSASTSTLAQLDAAVSSFVNNTGNNAASILYSPAGTGATDTTVQAKLRETVSVKDYGAVGNGTADDTTAIQNAINYVNSQGGGTVTFEAKDYLITSSLVMYSAVSLVGVGSGQYPTLANVTDPNFIALNKTRILVTSGFPSSTPMLSIVTPNSAQYGLQSVSVQGIMFDCANIANYGIKAVTVKHSFFKDILVFRPTVYGIWEDCLPSSVTGTAQAGASSTITLQATNSSITDGWYNGLTIATTGGTGSGQTRTISSYVGSTQVATVSSAWSVTPDATTTYLITGVEPAKTNAASQFNTWNQITIWAADNPSSATGWYFNGDNISDVNQCIYDNIKIVVRDGDSVTMQNGDANVFQSINTFNFGATGVGFRLKGNDKNTAQFARHNTIVWCQLTGPGTNGGLIAEGGLESPTDANVALCYSTGNSAPLPVIQSGANFWFNVDRMFPHTWYTFTPTVSFATPGDLSVAYTVQNGRYWKVGCVVNFQISLSFTPTHTTASGDFLILGLPIQPNNLTTGYQVTATNSGVGLTYPAGRTTLTGRVLPGSPNTIKLVTSGSGVGIAFITSAEVATGGTVIVQVGGSYEAFN